MPERILTLIIREQIVTIISTITALLAGITTIVLSVIGDFGRGGGTGGSATKGEGWLEKLANAIKLLTGKAAEAVKAIVVSVLGAILSFLKKTVGFIGEHTLALIVFVAGLVGVWLMQKFIKS